jgi:aspartyl aminopeptidase
MNKDWDILKQHNYELIKTFCEQSLEEAYRDVKEKLSKKTYKKAGGYAAYRNDMNIVKLKYKQSVKGTDEKVVCFISLLFYYSILFLTKIYLVF